MNGPALSQAGKMTAAIVVLYFPQWTVLQKLLDSLSGQLGKIYLISNGMDDQVRVALREFSESCIITELPNNLGLGTALNIGIKQAIEDQYELALLFDQDSSPPINFLDEMIGEVKKIPKSNRTWAAIGPSFYDARSSGEIILNRFKKNTKAETSINQHSSIISTDCLITSGMLLNLKRLRPFPKFDESFFVDQVDSEWCFRLVSLGYLLFGTTNVRLLHRLSDSMPKHFGRLTFLRYSPIRRYWYYKNSIRLIRCSYTPTHWRFRLAGILAISFIPNLLMDKNYWQSFKMMTKGVFDGFWSVDE